MRCANIERLLDPTQRGIWRFRRFFNVEVEPEYRLTVGEGNTPTTPLHTGRQRIWLKREDFNPDGSHKDRSLAYQVSLAKQRGEKGLVISSSGNAAISAARFCQLAGIKLWVFLSPKINRGKFSAAKKYGARIVLSRRAVRLANYLTVRKHLTNLRPSTNDDSLDGFKSLGLELFEQFDKPSLPVFTYVTSGSSLLGMAAAFDELRQRGCLANLPAWQAVQADQSLAKIRSRRWEKVENVVKRTSGRIWSISQAEISSAAELLRENNIKTSLEGCASLAAACRSGAPEAVCILTGKYYEDESLTREELSSVYRAESLDDLDKIMSHE